MNSHREELESRPPLSPAPGVDVGSGRWMAGWLAIWFVAHVATWATVDAYFVDASSRDGFAAAMGLGLLGYAAQGVLASYFVAKVTRRSWTFLAGAAVTGFGVGALLVLTGGGGLLYDLIAYTWLGLSVGGIVLVIQNWLQRRRLHKTASP